MSLTPRKKSCGLDLGLEFSISLPVATLRPWLEWEEGRRIEEVSAGKYYVGKLSIPISPTLDMRSKLH